MSSIDFHIRKKQLDDPAAAYALQQGEIDDASKLTLQQLSEKRTLLLGQHRESQQQGKIISRQIGEAKKNNHSADDLLQQMQTHSRDTKLLAEQCTQIENEILSFFNADKNTSQFSIAISSRVSKQSAENPGQKTSTDLTPLAANSRNV